MLIWSDSMCARGTKALIDWNARRDRRDEGLLHDHFNIENWLSRSYSMNLKLQIIDMRSEVMRSILIRNCNTPSRIQLFMSCNSDRLFKSLHLMNSICRFDRIQCVCLERKRTLMHDRRDRRVIESSILQLKTVDMIALIVFNMTIDRFDHCFASIKCESKLARPHWSVSQSVQSDA